MRPYLKNLLVTVATLIPCLSATFCPAQDAARHLHAGLLGCTGGIENQASLLSPSAIGQIFSEPARGTPLPAVAPRQSFILRYGNLSFDDYDLDHGYGSIPFFGLATTKSMSEQFSWRFAGDIATGTHWREIDLLLCSMKTSLLFHPNLSDQEAPVFRPYLGLGFELNYILQSYLSGEPGDFGLGLERVNSTDWGFGGHFLMGAEFVIDRFSLGLELGWSAVEISGSDDDPGGVSLLLNLGFLF